jgi:integrase
MTVGRYPELTVEQARKEAQKLLGKIAIGIDPVLEKQATKVRQIKLGEAFQDYLKTRKSLKPETLRNYHKVMNFAFKDWHNKLLLSISKDKIAKHHTLLGTHHGKAYANLAMRLLRAIFNFAASQYEDEQGKSLITENPVKRLSQTRAWYRIERRKSFIKSHELGVWHQGVMALKNDILRDYLLLLLFTGLRRQEAATLKWDSIDLIGKSLTILDTKNNQSHTLPLSDYIYNLLKERYEKRAGEYVFPGTGAGGYIVEPRKQITKVIESTGIQFMIHDLRRTFVTIAESLDILAYALKRLVNHKMNNDVTAGYIMSDVERLRKPMQQISEYIVSRFTSINETKNFFEIAYE